MRREWIPAARAKPSETAVVYGAGPMGLFWISLLHKAGARKIVCVEICVQEKRSGGQSGCRCNC